MQNTDVRRFRSAGQQIIREGRGQRLSAVVERHFFIERGADALDRAAVDLPIDNHRIDQHAAVFNHDIVKNFHLADLGIDGNDNRVGGITESAGIHVRFIADSHL